MNDPLGSAEFQRWGRSEEALAAAEAEHDEAARAFADLLHQWLLSVEWRKALDAISRISGDHPNHHWVEMAVTNAKIHVLARMPYADYLRTEHWQEVRRGALERAGDRCQACSSDRRLQVHHRTYERRGWEAPEDLTVLCADCHQTFHEHRRLVRA